MIIIHTVVIENIAQANKSWAKHSPERK